MIIALKPEVLSVVTAAQDETRRHSAALSQLLVLSSCSTAVGPLVVKQNRLKELSVKVDRMSMVSRVAHDALCVWSKLK